MTQYILKKILTLYQPDHTKSDYNRYGTLPLFNGQI